MAEAISTGNAILSRLNNAKFPNFFPLRCDISLHKSSANIDGSPNWILHDPASGKYLKIGWLEREIIARWHFASPIVIAQSIIQETAISVTPEKVEILARQLLAQGFLKAEWRQLAALHKQQISRQAKSATKLASSLLFPRFPLVRPQRFLRASYPIVSMFFSRQFLYFTFGILLIALFLVSRQLSEFTTTFAFMFSGQGIFAAVLVLIASKICHELAHAYVATKYGVSVPVMGIGLFVLFPILYTETSNAWLITDRKARISIAMAGMLAEMVLASYALFFWSFAPVGIIKSSLFVMASTIWILSLLVNLNPLVRFDGYFILSDILKLDNLSPRAFVFGKFLLHRLLTGVRISDPEIGSSKRLRFWLGVYFCAAIAYRLTLFVGICLAMLYFLPTVAAIPMCALVIGVFIAKPVAVEFSNISKLAWKNRSYLYLINMALLIGLILGVLFFPIRSTITGHAVVMPGESVQIFAVEPGKMMGFDLGNGKRVEVGDTLFLIQSNELDAQISGTYARMKSLEKFVQRQVTDPEFRAAKTPYSEQLQQVQQLYQGLVTRKAAMTMKAPISGVLRDVEKSQRLGEWVNTRKPIARIVSDQGPEIITYFDERNVSKIIAGTVATLVIDGLPEKAFPLTFVDVDPTAQATLLNPILASVHGGPIPVRLNRANQLIPETGIYRATFVPTDAKLISELPQRVLRGQVQVEGQATPLIIGFYRAIAGVILRETGVSLPAWWDS